jgi:RNA polymerase sigma-70 factor (ECF subfamily)
MTQISEQQLVQSVLQGDRGALGRLLDAYQARLYNLVLRMVGNREDAADVAQESMLKIVEHIHDFRGQSSIWTWMARIAMNLAISHLRKRQVRSAVSLEHSPGPASAAPPDQSAALREQIADHREPSPESSVQRQEMLNYLRIGLQHIEDDFRAVLVLRDIDEMGYEQIAQVLAIPVGTVKSRLFRARLALRHEMLRLCPPHPIRPVATRDSSHG